MATKNKAAAEKLAERYGSTVEAAERFLAASEALRQHVRSCPECRQSWREERAVAMNCKQGDELVNRQDGFATAMQG